ATPAIPVQLTFAARFQRCLRQFIRAPWQIAVPTWHLGRRRRGGPGRIHVCDPPGAKARHTGFAPRVPDVTPGTLVTTTDARRVWPCTESLKRWMNLAPLSKKPAACR